MVKMNKHIEIVSSRDPRLSSMGKKSRDAARATLAKSYARVGISLIDDRSDLQALVASQPDMVFLGLKYITDNSAETASNIWISQYLAAQGIAFTGSGLAAHVLELDKPMAKGRALAAGLNTSEWLVVEQGQTLLPSDVNIDYPLFVKPTDRGGGVGVDQASLVHNFQQLKSKVKTISQRLKSDSLIEKYLPGREFSVALLRDIDLANLRVMPLEIVAEAQDGASFLSAAVKLANKERVLAVDDGELRQQLSDLAFDAFTALGATDYGRIDIRLDARGEPQFMEANLLPSLIEGYGNFPKACALNLGLGYEDMLLTIVNLAFDRQVETTEPIKPLVLSTGPYLAL
ncbi:MAG TPA: hypothetical protein VGA08_03440 [Candidatus Saccharimonadales bacterium]